MTYLTTLKRVVFSWLALLIAVSAGFGLSAATAQDDTPIVCDSSLVAQVLVAELDLGYLPPEGIERLDFGQFTPIHEAIQARMQEMSAEEMAEAEANMAEMTDMMEAMENMEMLADVTVLQPLTVADQVQFCNLLRANLDSFLYLHLALELNMIDAG